MGGEEVGVLGGGRMGEIHIRTLLSIPSVTIRYVLARTQKTLAELKEAFPTLHFQGTSFLTSDQEDIIFSDTRVSAVVVASPSGEHERQIKKALEAGKAVFCEKPLARDIQGTRALFQLARQKDLPLFCAFQRRFDPSFQALEKEARAGQIGKVHVVKSCSRDPASGFVPGKTEYSIFFDSTVHDIDMSCWVLAEWPEQVFAVGAAHDGREGDWDTIALTLRFPSGAIALIDQSRHSAYGYDQRLEVFGEKGMLEVGNERKTTLTSTSSTGSIQANPSGYFAQRYQVAYREEVFHFFRVLQGKERNSVESEDVIVGLQIAEAAERSIRDGIPIQLQLPKRPTVHDSHIQT